jgi:hypothetical protein
MGMRTKFSYGFLVGEDCEEKKSRGVSCGEVLG